MNIQLFRNKTGLIYGGDNKRIRCNEVGVLKIGDCQINVSDEDCVMPLIFYGASGDYDATYITGGNTYTLERVSVRNGRILPPSSERVELMELHVRADTADKERDDIKADIDKLKKIFDTDSLNFLIK